MPDPPFSVYQDQLTELSHGIALWNPNPSKEIYNMVSIGDVGYLHEGAFTRMFNVTLPWNHPSNALLGIPEPYDPLDNGPFANISEYHHFGKVVFHSHYVTEETNAGKSQDMASDE